MSKWGDELPDYKAKKRGQIDAEKMAGKGKSKRKPKPWKVMGFFLGREYVAHRGVDEAAVGHAQFLTAQQQMSNTRVRRQFGHGLAMSGQFALSIHRAQTRQQLHCLGIRGSRRRVEPDQLIGLHAPTHQLQG